RSPGARAAARRQPQQQAAERPGVPGGVVAGQPRAGRLPQGGDQDRRPRQQQEGHRGEQPQRPLAQVALDEVARDVGGERQQQRGEAQGQREPGQRGQPGGGPAAGGPGAVVAEEQAGTAEVGGDEDQPLGHGPPGRPADDAAGEGQAGGQGRQGQQAVGDQGPGDAVHLLELLVAAEEDVGQHVEGLAQGDDEDHQASLGAIPGRQDDAGDDQQGEGGHVQGQPEVVAEVVLAAGVAGLHAPGLEVAEGQDRGGDGQGEGELAEHLGAAQAGDDQQDAPLAA